MEGKPFIKTERKLLIVATSQHFYSMPSTVVIGPVCGTQEMIRWCPEGGLGIERIGRREGKMTGQIKKSTVNFTNL